MECMRRWRMIDGCMSRWTVLEGEGWLMKCIRSRMIDEIYEKIDWLNVWEGEGEIWLMECMRRWKMIDLMNEKEKGMDD